MAGKPGFWDATASTLATVAPTIASFLGGPLAGTAVGVICNALGLDPATPQAQVAAAVAAATPAQLGALKAQEQSFAEEMRRLDITAEQLALGDTASARSMQTETRDPTPRYLAVALTAGYFALLLLMAFRELPSNNAALLNTIIGALGTGFTLMLSFYYGGAVQQMSKSGGK